MKKTQRSCSKAGEKGKEPRQWPDGSQRGHRLAVTVSPHCRDTYLVFFSSIQPLIFTKVRETQGHGDE